MIELNYAGETFELRNEPKELTLKEFENYYNIVNDPKYENRQIDKYFKVFEMMGVPDEILDALDQEEFVKLVNAFNNYKIDTKLKRKIKVGKRSYVAFEGKAADFKFMARDISLIERAANLEDGHFPSWVLAVMFKDEELTPTEHKDWSHIKHKQKLFLENLMSDVALPYISRFARRQVKTMENLQKDLKEINDGAEKA